MALSHRIPPNRRRKDGHIHSPNMTIGAKKNYDPPGKNDQTNRIKKTYVLILDRESRDVERTRKNRKSANQTAPTKSILYTRLTKTGLKRRKRAQIQRKKENIGNNKDGRKLLRAALPTSQQQKDIAHQKTQNAQNTDDENPQEITNFHTVQTEKIRSMNIIEIARLKHIKTPTKQVRRKGSFF